MKFSQLSDEEEEILDIMQEECAEIIQAIAKIKRHGYLSQHPAREDDNLIDLLREMGDLDCIRAIWSMSMGPTNSYINSAKIAGFALEKKARLSRYTHHIDWSKYS